MNTSQTGYGPEAILLFDLLNRFAGPCVFCAGPDSRHRLYDSVMTALVCGDAIEQVMDNYELTRPVVERFMKAIQMSMELECQS